MKLKAEKRENKKRNNSKMLVRGRSIFTLARIIMERRVAAAEKLNKKS